MWRCIAIDFEDVNDVFFDVDRIERNDLEDHRKEYHSIRRDDYIDKGQVNNHLQVLDRAKHLAEAL